MSRSNSARRVQRDPQHPRVVNKISVERIHRRGKATRDRANQKFDGRSGDPVVAESVVELCRTFVVFCEDSHIRKRTQASTQGQGWWPPTHLRTSLDKTYAYNRPITTPTAAGALTIRWR